MEYYAHRTDSENTSEWQLLRHHLEGVAQYAKRYSDVFYAGDWGYAVGLYHDLGKYSLKFQKRLRGSHHKVDHSTAGAQALYQQWGKEYGMLVAYVIAGHHSGLPNGGTISSETSCLMTRLKRNDIEAYEHAYDEIVQLDRPSFPSFVPGKHPGMFFSMFIRMLYSSLVDADSLDTERVCNPDRSVLRNIPINIGILLERYDQYMLRFSTPTTDIQRYRNELLHESLQQAEGPQGLYTLNMPTGSGKTLASLGFALYHARTHHLSRIIYVIPYSSIIEQNAAIFREVLGTEYVLEHHTNIQRDLLHESTEFQSMRDKLQLAEENWDAPVIVTTNVQFFESLFSNKRSKCRKLHNIANSVVIFDEAQMINGDFFKPCLHAVEELTRNYNVTALFCSGTQPEIGQLLPQAKIREVVQNVPLRYQQFRRNSIHQLPMQSIGELASHLLEYEQVLCIVNTRRAARELYQELQQQRVDSDVPLFHLSARMYAQHRTEILNNIRERLIQSLPCIVISTQLIEAGVDIDFPIVFRELAGLDSIAQAAGRCNRNGRAINGDVYVFELEQGLPAGWFRLTGSVTQNILQRYQDQSLSMEAVRDYFNELYFYQTSTGTDRTDMKNILKQLDERSREMVFPFQEVSHLFKLIDTNMETVIVPRGQHVNELIESLKSAIYMRKDLRRLQPYTVQLYREEFMAYWKSGGLEEVRDGVFVLQHEDRCYSPDMGLLPFSEKHHRLENYII